MRPEMKRRWTMVCPTCGGNGEVEGGPAGPCPTCEGSGQLPDLPSDSDDSDDEEDR